MIIYQITDCSGEQIYYTHSNLSASGLGLGSYFQTQEYPGVCFQITLITDDTEYQGTTQDITHVGPIFSSCTECAEGTLEGCTDPIACNYNPCATIDDGSCFYNNVTIRILCNDPITTCNINANCN